MDWLWIFLITLTVMSSISSMYAARQSRIKAVASAPDRSRICSCGHGYGTHRDGRSCQGSTEVTNYWSNGSRNGKKWAKCPCTLFDGTPPIDVLGWTPPQVKP